MLLISPGSSFHKTQLAIISKVFFSKHLTFGIEKQSVSLNLYGTCLNKTLNHKIWSSTKLYLKTWFKIIWSTIFETGNQPRDLKTPEPTCALESMLRTNHTILFWVTWSLFFKSLDEPGYQKRACKKALSK